MTWTIAGAFILAAVVGGVIVWWCYREIAYGIKDI